MRFTGRDFCGICDQEIRVQIFRGTGYCSILCEKAADNAVS